MLATAGWPSGSRPTAPRPGATGSSAPVASPDPVGVVQATVASDGTTADVAWEIGVPWQGRGYATEAAIAMVAWLEAHGVGTIRALIHPAHVASARVAERVGLVPTAEREDGEVVWVIPSGAGDAS